MSENIEIRIKSKPLRLIIISSLVLVFLGFVFSVVGGDSFFNNNDVTGKIVTDTPTGSNVERIQTAAPSGGSCGGGSSCGEGGGCGCGCGGVRAPRTQVEIEETGNELIDAENAGKKYYIDKYDDSEITAEAEDAGCHIEVRILKEGKVIKKLGYYAGEGVYEYLR